MSPATCSVGIGAHKPEAQIHATVVGRKTQQWRSDYCLLQKALAPLPFTTVNKFLHLLMLLQLENTGEEDINKLLAYAQQNHLKLSLVDDSDQYHLPGKPLTDEQITQLIDSSRKSGIISMHDAFASLIQLVNYIETNNTRSAGMRWAKPL